MDWYPRFFRYRTPFERELDRLQISLDVSSLLNLGVEFGIVSKGSPRLMLCMVNRDIKVTRHDFEYEMKLVLGFPNVHATCDDIPTGIDQHC